MQWEQGALGHAAKYYARTSVQLIQSIMEITVILTSSTFIRGVKSGVGFSKGRKLRESTAKPKEKDIYRYLQFQKGDNICPNQC